ncbi:MAG TPA: hypothetical protein VJT49_15630 [Amycolatopsis sp.]|uniref:hypothetical protein n=1 Tax=Amycolatopsis sp. TaxID=37632 RepID=UPI002B49DC24|nr:hypothetical protein [Amycolatopsis sp.]HKS46509.1 hypothetical protein [Amycolatopsis sp.]
MLTVAEADRALAELGAESDRMAEALVAMDAHPGHQLLTAGTLTGLTQRRWTEASVAMSVLWERFGAHRAVLDQAREVRARRTRPGEDELTELTRLLTEPVVELRAERLPLERRGLTGPATVVERATLTDLVARMKASYAMVTEVLAAAEKAWHTTVEQLDPLDTELRAASSLAGSLGVAEPELDRIAEDLARVRRLAVADPLAAAGPPESLSARIATIRGELKRLAAARDALDERLGRLASLIGEVAGIGTETRAAHAIVLEKIASPGVPPLTDPVPALRARLAGLPELTGRWRDLAAALENLERDAGTALAEARDHRDLVTGLLDRRLELRGRLDAYRAKAKHLGYAEDLELAALHREARELLYTVPCDLRVATRAVKRYQDALRRVER